MAHRLAVAALTLLLTVGCVGLEDVLPDPSAVTGTIKVLTDPQGVVEERHALVALEQPDANGDQEVLLLLNENTDVRRDGEPVDVTALAVGQRVRASLGAPGQPLEGWVSRVEIFSE